MKDAFKKFESILSNHLFKLVKLFHVEKIDLYDPTEEEKWLVFQYRIIQIIHAAVKEALKK